MKPLLPVINTMGFEVGIDQFLDSAGRIKHSSQSS
jgi:hypothetical protein